MNINPKSFFFRWYLGYFFRSKYDYPDTVCQLVWRFLWLSAVYAFIINGLIHIGVAFVLHGNGFNFTHFDGTNPPALLAISIIVASVFQLVLMVMGMLAMLIGSVVVAGLLLYAIIAGIQHLLHNTKTSNVVTGMVSGAYNRVKNKTCNLINYTS